MPELMITAVVGGGSGGFSVSSTKSGTDLIDARNVYGVEKKEIEDGYRKK